MPPPDAKALKDLDSVVHAATALTLQFRTALEALYQNPTAISTLSTDENAKPIDPIALTRDAASLVRAHATKLSLLIVNEPFSPNAISQVVRDLTGGPLPCLPAALDACHPDRYTVAYRKELARRCRDVLEELGLLLQRVPVDGKSLSSAGEGFSADGKGTIALTGLLWTACDKAISLANMGVGGFFVKKVEEWRDTLKDVMEELKDWGDEEPDDDEDEDEDDQAEEADVDDDHSNSAQAMVDELMSSGGTIPRSDPDKIRPRLETSLKRLRLVALLYQAIVKRRIKKLPPIRPSDEKDTPEAVKTIPQRLDEVIKVLAQLPDRFGDLAAAFYELDTVEIDQAMDQCFLDAFAVSELLGRSWDGGRDEFTDWTEKFQVEIRKE